MVEPPHKRKIVITLEGGDQEPEAKLRVDFESPMSLDDLLALATTSGAAAMAVRILELFQGEFVPGSLKLDGEGV
jgi:hypothetical protein